MTTEARPPQPRSVLRGHKAQVHAAAFVRRNERLLTGDADGFVVAWDLTIMRPRAVWQAHANAILGIAGWGQDRLITHGRDNKLVVWKFGADDESRLSTALPLDPAPEPRPQPWILHMLGVNTMNFCSFAHCSALPGTATSASPEILVAVPNTLASEAIDIFHLPSQSRHHTVKLGEKNGMVMALSLFYLHRTLTLAAGYENGQATVAQLDAQGNWNVKYQAKSHSQPVLSLDVAPGREFFLTSSADAIIAKHPLPAAPEAPPPAPDAHPDQTQPVIGIDARARAGASTTGGKSLLSAALASEARPRPAKEKEKEEGPPGKAALGVASVPLKTVNTKHSGQQSLRIRSDGRVFAAAGWDAKARVYSTRTLGEVAVLKWHQVGCYAATFAEIEPEGAVAEDAGGGGGEPAVGSSPSQGGTRQDGQGGTSLSTMPKLVELTVRHKRIHHARTAHWLAVGSKDGKVSLWDVF